MLNEEPEISLEQAALQAYVDQVLNAFRDRFGFLHLNQPNPDLGVLDRERAVKLITAAGRELAERCFSETGQANANARNAMMLFRAIHGWNRDEILKAIQQRTQIAIRAFGLLPLAEGEAGRDECYRRYLALREYERAGLQFAAQRRAGEQAAVQAALANLAQTAGYPDPTSLVRAMESELVKRAGEKPTRRVGDVTIELRGEGPDVGIHASRDGQALSTVPSAVKKSRPYSELRARADELRAQFIRLRAEFERLMVDGESFDADELAELATLPAVGWILSRLVFRDAGGTFGLYDARRGAFEGFQGCAVSVTGELAIAHPTALEEAGSLTDWQREIVRRRIVQPFKQVFRETYRETPHERLAKKPLSARAAGKWLNNQGWQVLPGEMPEQSVIFRPFHEASLQAVLTLDDPGRLLAGKGDVEVQMVAFRTLPGRYEQPERIAVEDVPLPIRSEVFRDCDLLGAEALRGKGWSPSGEVLRRRAEVIAALAQVVPLEPATVGETSVEVTGPSGTFGVSLFDGSVTPEQPIPAHWSEVKDLYLPFPGSNDATLAEIVHRVKWLSRGA